RGPSLVSAAPARRPDPATVAGPGSPGLLDGVLEALPSAETGGLRGRDLDRLTGAGIPSGARLPLLGLERPEARNLDARAILQRLRDDAAVRREEGVDRPGSVGLGHAGAAGKLVHEFGLVHLAAPMEWKG